MVPITARVEATDHAPTGSVAAREIRQRIRMARHLSPGEQKVAQFYLESVPGAAFLTAAMVSQACGVSTATVTRFAHQLGFNDFRQFADWMVSHARRQLERPGDRLALEHDHHTPPRAAFQRGIRDLQVTLEDLDEDAFTRTADLLTAVERPVYLGAVASGQPLMQHFGMLLSYLRGNITILDGVDRWAHQLAGLTTDGIVLATAYDRDPLPMMGLLQLTHELGATSIVITNVHHSPLIPMADIALVTNTQRGTVFGSRVSSLCLLEALLGAVETGIGGQHERATAIERAFDALAIHPAKDVETSPRPT